MRFIAIGIIAIIIIVICSRSLFLRKIVNPIPTIIIPTGQADDTLLTEQRNLLDLINKLEGGLGQVRRGSWHGECFCFDSWQSYLSVGAILPELSFLSDLSVNDLPCRL